MMVLPYLGPEFLEQVGAQIPDNSWLISPLASSTLSEAASPALLGGGELRGSQTASLREGWGHTEGF